MSPTTRRIGIPTRMIRFSTLYIHLYILLYTPYGSTLGRYPDLDGTLAPILSPFSVTEHTYITEYRSEKFQWLPTNFEVDDDGHVKATSYINNLHPSHDGLYRCIEGVIKCFVPLWERVLTDMIHELPTRIQGSYLPLRSSNISALERMEIMKEKWRRKRTKVKRRR